MSTIFVSYAREDESKAKVIARSLEDGGWSVWWDRELAAGDTWERKILTELDRASYVVVLWSARSLESRWVRKETEIARERGCLVPVVLGDVEQPPEFEEIQSIRMSWPGGGQGHPSSEASAGPSNAWPHAYARRCSLSTTRSPIYF